MSSPILIGSSSLIESTDSPDWSFGEKITCTRVFRGPYATALSSAPFPGAAGTGDLLNYYVKSSRVSREERGIGKLQITYEPGNNTFEGGGPSGALLPPDECGITMERLDRDLLTHPRYASLSEIEVDAIRQLQGNWSEYTEKIPDGETRTLGEIVVDSALATEAYLKLKRGFIVYPLWVPVYRWAIHYWTCPSCSEGGLHRDTLRSDHGTVCRLAEASRLGQFQRHALGLGEVLDWWPGRGFGYLPRPMKIRTTIPPKEELIASMAASGMEFAPLTATRIQFILDLGHQTTELGESEHCEMLLALTQPLTELQKAFSDGRDIFRAEALRVYRTSGMSLGALVGVVNLGLGPLRKSLPPDRTKEGEKPGSHWN